MKQFKNNGKLKLLIIVGTRPEIIRLAAVINKCRQYFDTLLAHTGQNYDYNLNGIFFKDLKIDEPDIYMEAVGDDLGSTIGNIIDKSYKIMVETQPDAVLVLGDTNSCLSVIGAKRLHIPIFHMEAGNRCKDECLPEETNRRIVDIISDVNMAYSEHARRYLAECGLPKERTYVTGSPMAEVLHQNLAEIEASDIHQRLGLQKGRYILLSAHREENIDTEKNFLSLFTAINKMAEKYDMPILYSCHPRSRKRLEQSGFQLDSRVIQHEPLGFHDYNCLQMNAFLHPHQHRTPRSTRQGMLLHRWHRHRVIATDRRHSCQHECQWRLRHPRARLYRGERIYQGGEDYPELHRYCKQNGLEKRIRQENEDTDLHQPLLSGDLQGQRHSMAPARAGT